MVAAGQAMVGDSTEEAGTSIVTAAAAVDRTTTVTVPPKHDYSDHVTLGRLKPGKAREAHRVVHVFPLVPNLPHATMVTARCGETLPVDDLQWLPRIAGMPCERCVLKSLTGHQGR